MYSPKIRDELIRPLYIHSKEIGVPMTETTNRYIVQGFVADSLSSEVESALPNSYQNNLKHFGLEDIVKTELKDTKFVEDLYPFQCSNEIMKWYESALLGTKRALLGAKLNELHSHSKHRDPLHQTWLYKTLAMNLNRGLSNALINYSVQESFSDLGNHGSIH